jgi:predicted RNase H-like HicB family nuclease
MPDYSVQATWDAKAQIWVAESNDIPELATAAANLDELVERLSVTIPDLLEETRHLCLPRAPKSKCTPPKAASALSCFTPWHTRWPTASSRRSRSGRRSHLL